MHSIPLTFASLWLAAVSISAQRVIILDASGTGITTLAAAYAAAQPGDIIRIRTGIYTPVMTSKGVTVICDPTVQFLTFTFPTPVHLGVSGLPAGQTFVFRGGHLWTSTNHTITRFRISNCDGLVVIENTELVALHGMGDCQVNNSRNVSFRGCTINELAITKSAVGLASCTLKGAGLPALSCSNSQVTLAASNLTGQFFLSALDIQQRGRVVISADSTIASLVQPAITGSNDSSLWLHPKTTVGAITGVPTTLLEIPAVDTTGSLVGQVFTATVSSTPGSVTATLIGAPSSPLSFAFGDLWLHPSSPVLDVGVVPAPGIRIVKLTIPPVAVASPVLLQPVALLVSGALVLGTPAVAVLN